MFKYFYNSQRFNNSKIKLFPKVKTNFKNQNLILKKYEVDKKLINSK